MKEVALVSTGQHTLMQISCNVYPFCWYEQHEHAEGRNDGLIYIGGFKTREQAETWAKKQNMI